MAKSTTRFGWLHGLATLALALVLGTHGQAQDCDIDTNALMQQSGGDSNLFANLLLEATYDQCGVTRGEPLPSGGFGGLTPGHMPSVPGDGVPDIIYDSRTGLVILDTDGQEIAGYKFTSPHIDTGQWLDGSPVGEAIFPTETNTHDWAWVVGPDGVGRSIVNTHFDGTLQMVMSGSSNARGIVGRYAIAQFDPGVPSNQFGICRSRRLSNGSRRLVHHGGLYRREADRHAPRRITPKR